MKKADMLTYGQLRQWYDSYAQSMRNGDAQLEDAIGLKYSHTLRVCDEIERLCDSVSIAEGLRYCSYIAALLHDVARFEQFRIYRTFSDKLSENHARMGLKIIERTGILSEFDESDRSYILTAIGCHNEVTLPDMQSDELLVTKLLRDADKLDIYRIALDHYINPNPRRRDTVQVGIPDGNAVSPEVLQGVRDRTIVSYDKIRTVTDFKMIQLGWVYDLNFSYSFATVIERRYIENLEQHLPDTPEVREVVHSAKVFCNEQTIDSESSGYNR